MENKDLEKLQEAVKTYNPTNEEACSMFDRVEEKVSKVVKALNNSSTSNPYTNKQKIRMI